MGYETVQRTRLEFPLVYNDEELMIEAEVEIYWEEDDLGFEDNLFYSKRYDLSGYYITSFRVIDGYIESDVPVAYDCESYYGISNPDTKFLGVVDAKVAELVEDIDPPSFITDGFRVSELVEDTDPTSFIVDDFDDDMEAVA